MSPFGEDIIIVFIITVDAFMNLIWASGILLNATIITSLLVVTVISGHRY